MVGFVTSKAKGFQKLSWLFRIQRKSFKLGIFFERKRKERSNSFGNFYCPATKTVL